LTGESATLAGAQRNAGFFRSTELLASWSLTVMPDWGTNFGFFRSFGL
jgi:hypothetical protein